MRPTFNHPRFFEHRSLLLFFDFESQGFKNLSNIIFHISLPDLYSILFEPGSVDLGSKGFVTEEKLWNVPRKLYQKLGLNLGVQTHFWYNFCIFCIVPAFGFCLCLHWVQKCTGSAMALLWKANSKSEWNSGCLDDRGSLSASVSASVFDDYIDVGDRFWRRNVLATTLAVFITNTLYLLTLTSGTIIQKMSPTSKF